MIWGGGDEQGAVACLLWLLPAMSPLLPGGLWQDTAPGVHPGQGVTAVEGGKKGRGNRPAKQQS